MATQAIEQAQQPADNPETPKRRPVRRILILAMLGLAAGAAAGVFGIGPIVAKRRARASVDRVAADSMLRAGPAPIVHSLENLVLNPAGTNGTRFLMVTATFECRDAAAEQAMRDHEPEVRDHILAILGKKNVEQLTDIEQRDKIKQEILDTVASLFAKGAVRKLYLPQFVIQ